MTKDQKNEQIIVAIMGELGLRSKHELIEKFIKKHLPTVPDAKSVPMPSVSFGKLKNKGPVKCS